MIHSHFVDITIFYLLFTLLLQCSSFSYNLAFYLSLPHPQYTCLVLNHARFSNSTWIFYSVCLPLWFHARKFVAVSRRFRSCGMKITYISAINLIWLSMVFDFFRPSVRLLLFYIPNCQIYYLFGWLTVAKANVFCVLFLVGSSSTCNQWQSWILIEVKSVV